MKHFLILLYQEIRLHRRIPGDWAALVLFFLIVILLLPFAIGPEPETLRRLAPGFIWLAALLMNLLALDRLFKDDARDGTLDMMLLSPLPLPVLVLAKLFAETVLMLLVLALILGPAALLLNMDIHILPTIALSLILGIPSLVLLGGMASAITVSLHRNAALLTLLLVPFYIPVLIFAVAACDAAAIGGRAEPHLLLLSALLVFLLPVAPFIIAAALRHAED